MYPVAGDVRQVLSTLDADGLKLGLISNTWWSSRLHDADLGRAGLLEFLPIRVYSSSHGYVKPRPEIFAAGLEALGLDHRVELDDHVRADARLRSLEELPAVIAGWQEVGS